MATRQECEELWGGRAARQVDGRARRRTSGRRVHAAACAVREAADELAALNERETGKRWDDARGGVEAGVSTLVQYAELGRVHRERWGCRGLTPGTTDWVGGVDGAGATALPVASAAPINPAATAIGSFHGVNATTTPRGSGTMRSVASHRPCKLRPRCTRPNSAYWTRVLTPASTPPRASSQRLPVSRSFNAASSSAASRTAQAAACSAAPRSSADVRAHPPAAQRARPRAPSHSCRVAIGTLPTTSPVRGSSTVISSTSTSVTPGTYPAARAPSRRHLPPDDQRRGAGEDANRKRFGDREPRCALAGSLGDLPGVESHVVVDADQPLLLHRPRPRSSPRRWRLRRPPNPARPGTGFR